MPSFTEEYGLLLRPVAHLSYMIHKARLDYVNRENKKLSQAAPLPLSQERPCVCRTRLVGSPAEYNSWKTRQRVHPSASANR